MAISLQNFWTPLRKTAEAWTPSSSSLEKLLPGKLSAGSSVCSELREAISIEKRYLTSHVVHVDNLDSCLHRGYARHVIVHAKAASLRARLLFINLSNVQKRAEKIM